MRFLIQLMKILIIILIDGDSNSILSMKLSIEFKVKFTTVFKEMVVKKKESRLPDLAER